MVLAQVFHILVKSKSVDTRDETAIPGTHRERHLEPAALHQVLRELLGLLRPDRLNFPPRTLDLLLLGDLLLLLLLDELLGAGKLRAARCLLLFLAHTQLGEEFSPARDERFAEGEGAAFGVGCRDELCELGGLACGIFLGGEHGRGIDHTHGMV